MASTVLPNGIIIPEKYSRDWYNDLYHNWQELDNLLGGGTPKDGTLTIQKNGDTVGTFSANQATNETVNITVPTKTSDLTNDSNFVQSSDLATVATSGSYNDLTDTPTIPTVNNATLTIQQNGATVDTFTANASVDKTININTADDTKIPLAGSNAISGSLIPATDNSIDIGSSTKNIKMLYTKGINGINPGALSLPCNTYTDDHSNNLVYRDYEVGYGFETSYDCLITLRSQNYNGNYLIVNDTLNIRNSVSSGFSGVNLFARKGDLINVYCPAASINTGVTLRLFKLKGNE